MRLSPGRPTLALSAALLVASGLAACTGESGEGEAPTSVLMGVGPDIETFDRCPPVTERRLARQDFGFSGTLDIQGGDGETWVFTVDHWYAGGDTDLVAVRGNDVSISYFADTVHPGQTGPEEGGRYLVAGRGGEAYACLTRPWSERLAGRHEKAFSG
jgi:hypothetical protein